MEERVLWNASRLIGYTIEATDGSIGSVDNFLFDDRSWAIRWLVVDTGAWLPGRHVLVPPSCVDDPEVVDRRFPVRLSREQVKGSPDLDTDAPVSRQYETELYSHYGWTPYWVGGYVPLGGIAAPIAPPTAALVTAGSKPGVLVEGHGDPHLRATREVTGCYVHATDGDIGHIEDFLVDSGHWTIRYGVVDTKNWWPGKKVLVAPQWLESIDWAEGTVRANMTRQAIRNAPEYDANVTADQAYEERLWRHYGATGYWI
jgi:hypothetical protein